MTTVRRFDLSLPLVLPVGIGLVLLAQWLEGGRLSTLFQSTAALIVVGGTLGAILISFTPRELWETVRAVAALFTARPDRPDQAIDRIARYAALGRRKGLLALENEVEQEPDPLLRRGLMLAVDGVSASALESVLEAEIGARDQETERAARVLDAAGGYAPTLGILGAVLGLIQVMQNLSDPSRLGGGIAVAFVSTVYGVALANLILLPLASRVRESGQRDSRWRELMCEGALAVRNGENPRVIAQRLGASLDPDSQARAQRRIHAA